MNSLATQINGHAVTVEYHFWPGCPMKITGWGFGDAEPDEPDEIEIRAITNTDGYDVFYWVGDSDIERIECEIIKHERENRGARAA